MPADVLARVRVAARDVPDLAARKSRLSVTYRYLLSNAPAGETVRT